MKNKSIFVIIATILVVTIIGVGFYFIQKRREVIDSMKQNNIITDNEVGEDDNQKNVYNETGLKTYENKEYGYAFDYQKDWKLIDYYGEKEDFPNNRTINYKYVDLKEPNGNFGVIVGVKNESDSDWSSSTHSHITGIAAGDFVVAKEIKVAQGIAIKKPLIYKYQNDGKVITQLVWFCAPLKKGEKDFPCNDFSIGREKVAHAEIYTDSGGDLPKEKWDYIENQTEKILESLRFVD